MKTGNQVLPKIIPVGCEATITVRGQRGGPMLAARRSYAMRFFSKVNRTEDIRFTADTDEHGALCCELPFTSPGEYVLQVAPAEGEPPLIAACLFAVPPAWHSLRPFRGDLHVHTTGSDGRAAPIAMAVRARELGHDFVAITDHDKQAPALQAAEEAAALGMGLLILPGEEVTIREIGGHILALNASACVGKLRHGEPGETERARILSEEIGDRPLTPPLTSAQYAHALWTVRQIRSLGGYPIIAHPYWEGTTGKYYPPRALVAQLLADGECDAVELLGGSPSAAGNRLAIARYTEHALGGQRLAITGGSDAHDEDELAGAYSTIILAEELSPASIVAAVRERRSVACDHRSGRDVLTYGPFDLVEYADFLLREYFPHHDRLCRAEGLLCAQMLADPAADFRAPLAQIQRELRAWRESLWYAPATPAAG